MGVENLTEWYKTVAGIAAAAVACGYGVRAWVGENRGLLSSIPLVVYVLVACLGLAAVAKFVMAVEFVEAATFAQLIVVAFTACVVAVGGVGLVTNLAKPLADTVRDAKIQGGKFGVLLALGLSMSLLAACGAKQLQPIVDAETSVHARLIAFDDKLDAACDGGTLQPALCKNINGALAEVWSAKNLVNRQMRAGVNLDTVQADITKFKTALEALIAAVKTAGGAVVDSFLRELVVLRGTNLSWAE